MGSSLDFRAVTRPGVVDGTVTRVDLGASIGESAVVVVSYPSNFGPSAGQSAALLRACQHLTAAEDVVGFGVAPESVYSHRRFAEQADVSLPLLSDTDNDIAEALGGTELRTGGVSVPTRAVHVVDYRGRVAASWVAEDGSDLPDIERLREDIEALSPTASAWGCYRVGHARYTEGRRFLSRGLGECDDGEWAAARTTFEDACRELSHATDVFMKGQGLASDRLKRLNDRGRRRARTLWEAAEWLAGFAIAAQKGDGERKQRHRQEAARVLETVREGASLPEPAAARERTAASPR